LRGFGLRDWDRAGGVLLAGLVWRVSAMKMAKANNADLDAALELVGAMDAITGRWGALMPEAIAKPEGISENEYFDPDNAEQCIRLVAYLRELANRGSLMRVVFGMVVVLDPRNEVVDPDADTLEIHPKYAAAILQATGVAT
jgi:hypothetical protein